ncbi:hypothetical protein KDA11_07150 [Candidatus Saccharibacteria bacterium]|nr:hypothetical protein [Candidatus Saccharibacteria bacterium]
MLGASFSLHRSSELEIDKKKCLRAALQDLGFRRFRLMSYWNIHEAVQGHYDFNELDWQLDMVAEFGGKVSLCVGKRQPRWPECHIPDWAVIMPDEQWQIYLLEFIKTVVERYKNHPALESWQLENEALLKTFGHCLDQNYDPKRLQKEFDLIKKLDPKHPIIMTLSDSWGFPIRHPKPDIYAMSLYRITCDPDGNYHYSKRPPAFYKGRAAIISTFKNRPVFIHELQAEPWLNVAIRDCPVNSQLEYMNPEIIKETIQFAINTELSPIDLWGLEWWYWLKVKKRRPEVWQAVKQSLKAAND